MYISKVIQDSYKELIKNKETVFPKSTLTKMVAYSVTGFAALTAIGWYTGWSCENLLDKAQHLVGNEAFRLAEFTATVSFTASAVGVFRYGKKITWDAPHKERPQKPTRRSQPPPIGIVSLRKKDQMQSIR